MLSTLFPVVASLLRTDPPRWLSVTDIGIAVLLFGLCVVLWSRMGRRVDDHHRAVAQRITQVVLGLIPVLMAVFFLAGNRIRWSVLVPALAWRGWLLLYSLPYLVAGWDRHRLGS